MLGEGGIGESFWNGENGRRRINSTNKKKYFQPTLSVSVDGSIIVFSPVDRTT